MKTISPCFYKLLIIVLVPFSAAGQNAVKVDSSYSNWYYEQRMDLYENITPVRHEVVFLGNSITERGEWQQMLPGRVANRGIGGDNTFGVLARLDNVISLQPRKIFILIGINDLGRGLPVELIVRNYARIIHTLKEALPKASIYMESVLPLNEDILKYDYLKGKKKLIRELNTRIRELAQSEQLTYIDLHELFAGEDGQLKAAWTIDGIHLEPVAYYYWVEYLKEKKFL